MALDITLAGSTSDSYDTVTNADTYFASHWDASKVAAWAALSSGQKEGAMRQAAMIIETLNFWQDSAEATVTYDSNLRKCLITPYETNQALSFPRNIDINSSNVAFIPTDVKQAQFEQAIFLVSSMNESVVQSRARGLIAESVQAGSVSVSQSFESGGNQDTTSMMVSPIALMLLKKYIVKARRTVRE